MSWLKRYGFSRVQLAQIPREENTGADKLSQLNPSDPKTTTRILVELLNQPSTAKKPVVMAINALD